MKRTNDLAVIAGLVNPDGSIYAGEGFSVFNTAAGKWNLTFPPSFRVVSVTVTIAADALAFAVASGIIGGNTFQIRLYNSGGAALAQPWNFIAAGVRM